MANYIVGDIQGCYSALHSLLGKIGFNPETDTLWAVGDLIGRGQQARQTLDFLMQINAKVVLGNHDLHFLAVHCGIRKSKSRDHFDTLLEHPQRLNYVNWLRQQPLARMIDENSLLCHAGLYPTWSFQHALCLSDEVSQQLQADNWPTLLEKMYGNQPDHWQEDLQNAERWRVIINAFTRMRFLGEGLRLDMQHKSHPDDAPPGLTPWFALSNPALTRQQKIVFGHWAALLGKTAHRQYIALDTGYIWGNQLTVLHWETQQRYCLSA